MVDGTLLIEFVRRGIGCGWWTGGLVVLALSSLQFIPFFGRVAHSHNFIRFTPVWTVMRTQPWRLWFRALGLYVPLFFVAGFLLPKRSVAMQFYLGFLLVFIEANFIIFQPWELDNTKVLLAVFPAPCAFVACRFAPCPSSRY